MAKKGRRQAKKQRKQNRRMQSIPMSAPGASGFGATDDWNLRDIKPVLVPPGYIGQICALVVISGVNGLRYKVLDITGSSLTGGDYAYGNVTGQFSKLANLYSTYRLKSIRVDWRPEVLQVVGSQAQPITTIDVAAGDGLVDYPQSILNFSRSKNTRFHPALEVTTRDQDYTNWLTQALDHPYLRTILGGAREFYQDDGIDRVPAIQMLAVFTRNVEYQFVAGYLDTNVCYSFRGRRLDDQVLAQPTCLYTVATNQGSVQTPRDAQPQSQSAQVQQPQQVRQDEPRNFDPVQLTIVRDVPQQFCGRDKERYPTSGFYADIPGSSRSTQGR